MLLFGATLLKSKTNFKQSMIVSVINDNYDSGDGGYLYIYEYRNGYYSADYCKFFDYSSVSDFMMMSMYIYPMMVTFNLSIKQLYKNALLFAIMKFIPNLLILIVCFLVVIVPFYFAPFVGYILLIIITFGLVSYITNFYVYTKIDKYMIKRVNQSEEMTENVDQPVYEKIDESSQDSERQDLSE